MAKADKPIVIVGSGNDNLAALINKLVDVAYNTPAGAPPQNITVLHTPAAKKPRPDDAYPLNGKTVDQIHPFKTAKPPKGFPTFGEYIREMMVDDPSLKSALRVPTQGQISEYMDYVLDLAVMTVGDKALLETSRKGIESIDQKTKSGPGTINFKDGTTLEAKEIIRAEPPPHLGGPKQDADIQAKPRAAQSSGVKAFAAAANKPAKKPQSGKRAPSARAQVNV